MNAPSTVGGNWSWRMSEGISPRKGPLAIESVGPFREKRGRNDLIAPREKPPKASGERLSP
jgi:hypothetical protein